MSRYDHGTKWMNDSRQPARRTKKLTTLHIAKPKKYIPTGGKFDDPDKDRKDAYVYTMQRKAHPS